MTQELVDKFSALLDGGLFKVKSIDHINHKPHPYCITPKHVRVAADHHSGLLGTAAIEDAEQRGAKCGIYSHPHNPKQYTNGRRSGWERCNLSVKEHTSDRVCFLELLRDMSSKEGQKELKKLVTLCETEKVDGFAFMEGPFKFLKEEG
jgi:hypothetical protein